MRKLEQKYSKELFVIGVHSAKFMAEKATENVRQAILRYDLDHPVVNDADFQVWQQYGARAWPTFMFIDPEGKIIGRHEGEIPYDAMDRVLGEMVAQFDSSGLIDRRTIPHTLEKEKETDRPLSFPGKVHADGASGKLFVADSNHNRIVVSTLDGCVTDVIGSGEAGMSDGRFHVRQLPRSAGRSRGRRHAIRGRHEEPRDSLSRSGAAHGLDSGRHRPASQSLSLRRTRT